MGHRLSPTLLRVGFLLAPIQRGHRNECSMSLTLDSMRLLTVVRPSSNMEANRPDGGYGLCPLTGEATHRSNGVRPEIDLRFRSRSKQFTWPGDNLRGKPRLPIARVNGDRFFEFRHCRAELSLSGQHLCSQGMGSRLDILLVFGFPPTGKLGCRADVFQAR